MLTKISALLTLNLSFKFRFAVAFCCDAWFPVYSKHCDRPIHVVVEFMHETTVLSSTCMYDMLSS